ncbi:MAG: tyrA, partial [Ilumatobacteraceae bacterium]|nr:tyrA [Ilumatobacteraceae bacterium]
MTDPELGLPVGRRANIAGLGLIGGSIGLALSERGWTVTGDDLDPSRARRALDMGVISAIGVDAGADITFIATPVLAVADRAKRALSETTGVVTDVGSVKAGVAGAIDDPSFVGGHPMAGSELDGLDGADGSMFEGAIWVLTPTSTTSDQTFATIASVVAQFGAEVIALPPERHDHMVAVISHVPHLTAATLMGLASQRGEE